MRLTPAQREWIGRMRSNLKLLHTQWYGWSDEGGKVLGGMNETLFHDVDRMIRTACSRLSIEVKNADSLAEENEWWDGEMYGPLVVLERALNTIENGTHKKVFPATLATLASRYSGQWSAAASKKESYRRY